MNLTAEVMPCLHNMERWEAVLVIDGEGTTFSCSHTHHTSQAAAKCLQAVVERATKIVTDPTFRAVDVDTSRYGVSDVSGKLVEWRVQASMIPDDPTKFDSVRLWIHPSKPWFR